jgi:peptidylamidoglycolate lyase
MRGSLHHLSIIRSSFDEDNRYTKRMDGPIAVNTVLTLNPESGQVEDGWASDVFYLPHGIHVDAAGNVWLTDVALHQVFKVSSARQAPPRGVGPSSAASSGPCSLLRLSGVTSAALGAPLLTPSLKKKDKKRDQKEEEEEEEEEV